jgi:hypothetical protein
MREVPSDPSELTAEGLSEGRIARTIQTEHAK